MRNEYDLVILGWGAAAFSAAIRASEITSGQASIAMIGFGNLGGTCVNVGCVPSKYLIEAAKVAFTQRNPRYPGISSTETRIDFSVLMESLMSAVEGERKAKYVDVISQYDNVDLIEGKASFTGPSEVLVDGPSGAVRIKGFNFLIATGSSPAVPDIEGLRNVKYLTSNDVWGLRELPKSLAVLGGGAIGLELGQAFSRLGSRVTVIEAMPTILPQAEPEVSAALLESLRGEGIGFELKARVSKVYEEGGEKVIRLVTSDGQKEVRADEVLVATGRLPNVLGLNLEAAGVEYSRRGVRVDDALRTSNPRIYAAGDVVDQRLMLETLAAREGVTAVENMFEHAGMRIDMMSIPWAAFTEPQAASVGYTEREYSERGGCSCRSIGLASVPKARLMRESNGLFKIVVDPRTDKVVGVHVLSPNAAEIIMEGAYAVKHGLTYRDIIDSAHVFPTIAEGIKLAAQSFIRDVSKMSCCME
ncbi:mercury(II) reductase [Thermocladium modestius]|uniref:Mercuric reductase n=1 Tax=Thermocladium modestius TaxID=62609 RepID=A0A830GTC1_9CREN|nr:mercury(II) reductase [Thermocladium modestius]GGP20318.1 mercury(II) reductase [Thermocladium modestius]